MENYLVCSRAIAEFVNLKRKLSNTASLAQAVSESDVSNLLDECAESLKQLAVQKRLTKRLSKPLFPRLVPKSDVGLESPFVDMAKQEIGNIIESLTKTKDQIEEMLRQGCSEVDAEWDRRKLELVPGDELLDSICKRFGVRFVKEKDSSRLAAIFRQHEIPDEIKRIISEFAT
jgi:hypothetical protein